MFEFDRDGRRRFASEFDQLCLRSFARHVVSPGPLDDDRHFIFELPLPRNPEC
jgi:hypothetical protein